MKIHHSTRKAVFGCTSLLVCALGTYQLAFAASNRPVLDGGDAVVKTPRTNFSLELPEVGQIAGPNGFQDGYSTGFENGPDGNEGFGFVLGSIIGNPPGEPDPAKKWGHHPSVASLTQAHISDVHPATGTQHFRLGFDPGSAACGAAFARVTDGRIPTNTVATDGLHNGVPGGIITTNFDAAVFGVASDYLVGVQNNGTNNNGNAIMWRVGFDSISQSITYVFDRAGDFQHASAVTYDDTGTYHHFQVVYNQCFPDHIEVIYQYDGAEFAHTSFPIGQFDNAANQMFITSNNCQGSTFDFDNLAITRVECPPPTCGNGAWESGEECDASAGQDAFCPGRCVGPGGPDACTCNRGNVDCDSATLVANGVTGPLLTNGGFFKYTASSPFITIDTCASDFDTQILWDIDPTCSTFNVFNDECANTTFGGGQQAGEPTVSCYNPSGTTGFNGKSCLCVPVTPGQTYTFWANAYTTGGGDYPPLGSNLSINIFKKSSCGVHVGSCCDTNGPDQGCTENVISGDCVGPDKRWTENGKCPDPACACIPDCTGRSCGSDGCGGQCPVLPCNDSNLCTDDACNPATGLCESTPNTAPCDDGNACTTGDACAAGACVPGGPVNCSDGLVCNGIETCVAPGGCVAGTPLSCGDGNICNGQETCVEPNGCTPGTPLVCDDGVFCNGAETCVPSSGCQPGSEPCPDPDTHCDEASDTCASNSIPTVSEWGLVVLTLMLLIGAKVYFGRRQAIA